MVNDAVRSDVITPHDPRPVVDPDRTLQERERETGVGRETGGVM